nr:10549_t:CDS:10 [Entrophospora candida]
MDYNMDDFTFKRKKSNKSSGRKLFAKPDIPIIKKNLRENAAHVSTTLRKHNDNEFEGDVADWSMEGTGRRVAYEDFTTIDWIHDFAKERARQRKLQKKKGFRAQLNLLFDATEGWIIVSIVGIACGLLAAAIAITSEWLSDLKEGYCSTAFYLNRKFCCWGYEDEYVCTGWVPWNTALQARSESAEFWTNYFFYIIFSLLFATTAAYLVKTYSPYSAGSGLPEVKTILGGFVIRKFLGWSTLVIKSIGVCLVVASSLSLGNEGPLIHLACCCGNIIPRIFPKYRYNEAKKREILSAAAAAGVSVAFGAPIGGVVFSLEEVSYYFSFKTMWRSFFCAMVAAVSLAGLFGALFIRLNLKIATFRQESWIRYFPIQEVIVVSFLTSIISYLNIFMRVNPSELVANLFRECVGGDYHNLCNHDNYWEPTLLLLVASICKFFLTVVSFGLQVPAGLWLPSLAIGACFGRALGLIVHAWHSYHPNFWLFSSCLPDVPCITPGMYAMIGAAATFGGVTRMTVVIVFELTGALTYVLPIMITVMISKWVGDAFNKEGIYDGWIRMNEYPFLDSKEEYIYNTLASQVMTKVEDLLVIVSAGYTLNSLETILNDTNYKGFPVVHSSDDLLLNEKAKKQGISSSCPCYFSNNLPILDSSEFVDFRPWMDQTPITVSHKFPMEMVIELFRKMGLRYVLVTKNGQLLGLITKKDVLRHLSAINSTSRILDYNGYMPNNQSPNLMILPERRMDGYFNNNEI